MYLTTDCRGRKLGSVNQTLTAHAAGQMRAELARRQMPYVQLARLMGVDETWVGKRAKGRVEISLDDLYRISQAMDLPLLFFLPAEAIA
jgi:transcriptional regulator with XRE-family HTH domain